MADYEEKEKILSALRKRKIRVIEDLGDKFVVTFTMGMKTKIGYMNKKYTHRYGINTFCVLTYGSQFPWFKSNDYQDKIPSGFLPNYTNDKLDTYPLLDLSKLDITW